jgi:hypothetical protein
MQRFAFLSMALGMLAAVPACDGGTQGPELLAPEPCLGDAVTLDVRTGSNLEFAWAPACPVAWLDVYDDATKAGTWAVSGIGGNVIQPVVRYGLRPADAREIVAPASLSRGRAYTVRVLRLVAAPGGATTLTPAGVATFTR